MINYISTRDPQHKVTSSKADFTGLGYRFHATITVGDDGFANACRITERLYQLGTWHKWDWARNAELKYDKPIETLGFNVTPSKIQSKLKSHGITGLSVTDLENSIKQCCIDRYLGRVQKVEGKVFLEGKV